MEFVAAALGAKLRLLKKDDSTSGLERIVVIGTLSNFQASPDLKILLLIPCHMDDPNSNRLKTWIDNGPLPVFGEFRSFPENADSPWKLRDGGSPLRWSRERGLDVIQLGFDCIGPLFHWLSRQDEMQNESRKKYQSGLAAESWMESHGLVDYPWIDRMILFIEALLDLKDLPDTQCDTLMPRWPANKRWTAVLSHDVDMLFKWRFRSAVKLLLNSPGYMLSFQLRKFVSLWRELISKVCGGNDPWFLIDEMMELEKQHGVFSTFLFLTESHDTHTYRYHLDRIQIRSLLERIRENGFEVGLHAGWHSFLNRDCLKNEFLELERINGKSSNIVRQHWLRFDIEQTWRDQERCGFNLDSTLGFNDRAGYRAGTSLPFNPWMLHEQRSMELLEIPLVLMDSQLYDEQEMSLENGLECSNSLIDITRRSRGLLTINWHPHTLCLKDFPDRRLHYLQILEQLQSEDVHVCGLGDLAKHWNRREHYRRGGRLKGTHAFNESQMSQDKNSTPR
jgi:hypothetical protein